MSRISFPSALGFLVISCLVVAAFTAGCTSAATPDQEKKTLEGKLTIHGSTALSPTIEEQARVFTTQYPDVRIDVTGSSSGEAIYNLVSGKSDIAPSARTPTAAEYNEAKNTGKSLHMTVVGYDGVAVIVNTQNPVSNLSSGQLRQIFCDGTITTWDQIPGSGKTGPITVYVQDQKASASAEFFTSKIAPGVPFAATAIVVPGTSSEMLSKKVLTDPNGITFSSTAYLYPNMKALPVDGVSPKVASLHDGSYPISRKLYMITDGKPDGLTREFINFMFSDAGQKIATEKGIVPVSQVP